MLGISVIYTNLHKNEVCKSEKKVSKSLPFFSLLEQKISPHSSLRLFIFCNVRFLLKF